ncbi:hypothetical protein ACFC5H_29050 [Streptomyces rochei]|uniref:Uncharacterized protein n=2 Tax=Streptomyces rochei group TaxID=2867164 RepID=A0AAX3ZHF9_STRRO|nr:MULTISPECIES: hypothetical protein [Streptomyces]RIH60120.1 hypothetical protein D3C59_20690 [Streptomyces sp. SHP22-7]MBJ6619773.1 hypothetical protein [Streptomyces sp. DHE17-7]RSS08591.1 hypothetical protein EF915_34510 [Streptomyces sp. WAC08401]WMC86584.1 hypothetical protein P7W03_13880 [Streptomyces rochei]GGZ43805.1 hypothetical protein GCM10010301_15380 [Streptomyces plicatus]
MALIEKFQSVSSDTQRVHGPVTCGYRTFTVEGRRILQLDTYGSTERLIPDKISQSIQLDAESARELLKLITDSFPDLDQ